MGAIQAWLGTVELAKILLLILGAVVLRFILLRTVKTMTRRAIAKAKARTGRPETRADKLLAAVRGTNDERYEQRTATVASVASSLISITIWTITILTILAMLGVPLAPLLTSAGVGGIALAFGAQSLVKDFLSGLFMIFEDQYGVGDVINVGEVTGTVEEVALRVTRIRDGIGTVWYVRNGEILRVGNQSQGWSTAIVDVPVAYDEDPARAIGILEQVAEAMDADSDFAEILLDKPVVVGVNSVTANAMTIRITAKTLTNKHWPVQRALLERSLRALGDAGVRGPVVLPPVG